MKVIVSPREKQSLFLRFFEKMLMGQNKTETPLSLRQANFLPFPHHKQQRRARGTKQILASGPWAREPGLWSCGACWQGQPPGHPLPYPHPEQPAPHIGPLGGIGTCVLG